MSQLYQLDGKYLVTHCGPQELQEIGVEGVVLTPYQLLTDLPLRAHFKNAYR